MRSTADAFSPLSLHSHGAVPLSIPTKQDPKLGLKQDATQYSGKTIYSLMIRNHPTICDDRDGPDHYYPFSSRRESSSTMSVLSASLSTSISFSSIPSLQSDCYDAKIERRPRTQKFRESHAVQLVECPEDHPLIQKMSCIETNSLSKLENEDTSLRPLRFSTGRERFLDDEFSIAERAVYQDREMILLSSKISVMLNKNPRRHFRANSQYLRMFCAEREMLLKNKIRFIPSQPVLAPRADNNKPGATQIELGIALRWHKSRPKRVWRELTADDLS